MKLSNIKKYGDKRYWMRFRYARYLTSQPVDRSKILFESFHGKEISDSPLAIAREILDMPEHDNFELFFSTDNTVRDREVIDKMGLPVRLVHIHSDEYAKLLATAGILINNSSFPSYYVRRDEQVYLQTWHGTPWKTLGKQMKGRIETIHNSQHNFIQASHLLFPNDFTREVIMRDYNLQSIFTGKVIVHGYPRNAVFCNKERAAEIKHKCGDDNYRTLAYMPTWRGQDNKNIETSDFSAEIYALLEKIDANLADDQKLYVNLHPIVQDSIDVSGFAHIFTFPKEIEKYEFINSMDALITDYSSIFFDYSITRKPVILFTYDYDNYVSERGMYFDISELPFMRADSVDELSEMLRTGSYEKLDYSGEEKYISRFIQYDSPDAAAEIAKYIVRGEDSGLRIDDYGANRERKWNVIDCPKLSTPFDVDYFSETIDPEHDLVVFHQGDFTENSSKQLKDEYFDSYEYVFTTKAVPNTIREALSRDRSVKAGVKERELKREIGEIKPASYKKYNLAKVQVESISTSGTIATVKMSCPDSIGEITDVILEYRSNIESITLSMDHEISTVNRINTISASADMSKLKPGCVYWDLYVLVKKDGKPEKHHAMLDKKRRRKLKTGFYQCETGDYIAFPHISLFASLAFTHREKSPYDDRLTRYKEAAAYGTYRLFEPIYNRKNIWLVFEKFCSAAQDNGFYFFKYCMENLGENEKKDIYYVIDKKAKDYNNLKPYKDHVVQFMSLRHMIYCMAAKVYVGSDSRKHLYVWRPKPNLIVSRMRKKPTYFLQHGVTALKRVDSLFGAHGSSPMAHITTTSEYEQRIMDKYFGYSPVNAPIVGFTRWDVLEDKSDPEKRLILVMPTWRAWLEEKTDEDFLNSDYFRNYMEMLRDRSLSECLRESNTKLIFFIHPKFKDFLNKFSTDSENIELVQFGSKPLNEIMMQCSMLITDYSSVCWDMYYMGKPVVFYQFDYDMYMENHGSYLDMENELFGERYTELEDVIRSIRDNIANGFRESERAREMRSKYFKYIDSDNSKRTYEYLKSKGY